MTNPRRFLPQKIREQQFLELTGDVRLPFLKQEDSGTILLSVSLDATATIAAYMPSLPGLGARQEYILCNIGTDPLPIKDNEGNALFVLEGGQTEIVWATARGWAVSTSLSDSLAFGTAIAINAVNSTFPVGVKIGPNKIAVYFEDTTSTTPYVVIGQVTDGGRMQFGTPVQVSTTTHTAARGFPIAALGKDKCVIAYRNGTTTFGEAVVVTVTGLVPTVGTPFQFSNSAGISGMPTVVRLTSALCAVFFVASSSVQANVLQVTGATLASSGGVSSIYGSAPSGDAPIPVVVTSSSDLIVMNSANSTQFVVLTACSYSSTSVTAGNAHTVSASGTYTLGNGCKLGGRRALFTWRNPTSPNALEGVVVANNTHSTRQAVVASVSTLRTTFTGSNGLCTVGPNAALIAGTAGPGDMSVRKVSVMGSVAGAGGDYSPASGAQSGISIMPFSTKYSILFYQGNPSMAQLVKMGETL